MDINPFFKTNEGEVMNEYSIDCIDKLRIHELRDFARNVGVISPTTMKKEELIAKITEAVDKNNRIDVVGALPKTRRGIDFFALLMPENADLLDQMVEGKKVYNEDDFSYDLDRNITCNKINDEDCDVNDELSSYEPYNSYPHEMPEFSFGIAQNEMPYEILPDTVEGYLQIHSTGYGVIRKRGYIPSDDDIYLSSECVKKYSLKSGDKVKGYCKVVIVDKPMIMYEVVSVDGNPEQDKIIPFEMGRHNGFVESFYFDRFNINMKKGERVYIENLDFQYALKLAEDFKDDNNVNVKLINVRSMPEDLFIESENLEVVDCPFNLVDNHVISALDLIMDRIKREFEDNKPNVLILYNFSGLLRVLNTAVDGFLEYDKYDIRAINKVMNILYSAKYVDSNHNLTIICVDRKQINSVMKNVFDTEFKPLFNNLLDANDIGFFN